MSPVIHHPRHVGLTAGLAAAASALAIAAPAAPAAPAARPCPNDALRTGTSAHLRDCRAYEQVTPRDKPSANGSQTPWAIDAQPGWSQGDGNGFITTPAAGALAPDADRGVPNPVVSRRTADGWRSHNAFGGPYGPFTLVRSAFKQMTFSDDLTRFAFTSALRFSETEPPAVDNISNGGVYRTGPDGNEWLSRPTWPGAGVRPAGSFANHLFEVVGAASDLSTVTFSSRLLMAPEDTAAGRQNDTSWALYRTDGTTTTSASRLPDGTVDPGGAVGAGFPAFNGSDTWHGTDMEWTHTVSRDGHSALFVSPDPFGPDAGTRPPQLYRTVDGAPSTRISAAQDGTPAATGLQTLTPGIFAAASADHRFVFFSSDDALTSDVPGADATARKTYRYDTASGTLRYIPAMTAPEAGGSTTEYLLTISEDGRSAAFVIDHVLKVWKDDGSVRSITAPGVQWLDGGQARFSPKGNVLAMRAGAPVDEPPVVGDLSGSYFPDKSLNNIYRYDFASDAIRCVSCSPPNRLNPGGNATYLHSPWGQDAGLRNPRSFTADGRSLFFTTTASLTPDDDNAVNDVYEDRDGAVRLISGGRPGTRAAFYTDNSDDGRDVFFATADALADDDEDSLFDIYDARVDGGFAAVAPPAAPCTGDACQGAPSPQRPAGAPASATSAPEADAPRPGRTAPRTTLKVKRAKATRAGVRLDLTTSGPGRLRATGDGLTPAARSFDRRGTYRLQASLSAAARRTLARRGRVKVTVHVRFTPTFGAAASATTTLTVHRATR